METLQLIEPKIFLEKEYHQMLQEWHESGEPLIPFVLSYDSTNFNNFIDNLEGFKTGIGIPDTFVPHSTFWLIGFENKILGVANIRHHLNDKLLQEGGHIGYGIRPSERRKGYATKILELSLIEAKKLGITRALITCDHDNTGSRKAIINNNGILDHEHIYESKRKLNFWIDIL